MFLAILNGIFCWDGEYYPVNQSLHWYFSTDIMCMFSSLWPSSYFRFTVLWLSCRSFSRYSLTRLGLDTCDLLALVCYSFMVGFILEVVWIFFLGLSFVLDPSNISFLSTLVVIKYRFIPFFSFFYFDLYWPFRRLLSSLPYFMLVLSVVTYFLLHTCISLLFFCDFSRSLSLCL